MEAEIFELCKRARVASRAMAPRSREAKDRALEILASKIEASTAGILEANANDIALAKQKGLSDPMIDRLLLTDARIRALAESVREIARLADPVGTVVSSETRPNGIRVSRVRVPLGVIGMIYESRPNVTIDASALSLKSGNAIVLRGGSEAKHSNAVLTEIVRDALEEAGLPKDAVQSIPFVDRDAIRLLTWQTENVDLVIPRGGEALIRFVTETSRVPVVQHYKGVCHLYLDTGADEKRAVALTVNGKLSRPSVCNATECLLVAKADAERLLPPVLQAIVEGGGEIRGCEATRAIFPAAKAATPDDFGKEFLAPILAVRVVADLDAAIDHIARYGSGHTEAILTPNPANAEHFRAHVDAACVVVNASTRFHDGGELGLGAEIGIATSRLHWRGPMGLESLTTMKWLVSGDGHVRN